MVYPKKKKKTRSPSVKYVGVESAEKQIKTKFLKHVDGKTLKGFLLVFLNWGVLLIHYLITNEYLAKVLEFGP